MPRMQRPLILLAAVWPCSRCALRPHAAKRKVPRGFYAVMWDRAATEAPDVEQDAQWALMASSGVESVRTVFSWAEAQPEPGRDRLLVHGPGRRARRRATASSWCRSCAPRPAWAKLDPYAPGSPPRNPSDYAAFLQALIGRYGPTRLVLDRASRAAQAAACAPGRSGTSRTSNDWWNTDGRSPNAWAPEYAALLKTAKTGDRRGRPGRDGRARRAGRLRLEAPRPAQPVQDRPLLRRRGDQPVHGAPAPP